MAQKSYNQILDEHLHILIAQGNHEAFNKLNKRYHKHASVLAHELMKQYGYIGITLKELIVVCEDHFPFVVLKYVPGKSSFYTFWKGSTLQCLMDYLIENSYDGDAYVFKGSISFDQKNEEMHSFSELIGESGDERMIKKKIFEIKYVMHKYQVFFSYQEKTLLNLILEGYTLAELEHTGLLAKSQLNLTYKSAIEKVRKYIGEAN